MTTDSNHTADEEYEDDKVVETSPDGRFVRFEHILGSGAFKTVFRAMDTDVGIEVAWNQVLIDRYQLDKTKVLREIEFFQQIRHQNVIEFYHFWVDEEKNQVVFITELMPSGTLTQYIEKSPEVKVKIIKGWCRQVLLGLDYLHTQTPPIIHRDIKCGNIFINGTTEGEVKIGDLGLATFCQKKDALSVIGTPEFMAPEYYNEVYTTTVDIWAFGMAMIEMVTLQCPYQECDNVGQIFKKVSGGVLPQQLSLILDPEVKGFIELCLQDEQIRPTAAQLLAHPFFYPDQENDNVPVRIARSLDEVPTLNVSPTKPIAPGTPSHLPSIGEPVDSSLLPDQSYEENAKTPASIHDGVHAEDTSVPLQVLDDFLVTDVEKNDECLEITVSMDAAGENSEIVFEYNIGQDTPEKVATEMVREMQLQSAAYHLIYQSLEQVERDYSVNPIDHKTHLSEVSELESYRSLASSSNDAIVPRDPPLHSSGDSIKSEPLPPLRGDVDPSLGAASSWSEPASEPEFSFSEENGLTNLESLVDMTDQVDPSPRFPYTLPPRSDANDMTDLEDLLDDEDMFSDDSDSHAERQSELSSGDENSPPASENLHPDTDECDLTSEEEDEQAIQALKEKHELAMKALLKSQEDELRKATERRSRKRGGSTITTPEMAHKNSERSSYSVPSLSHMETTQALQNFYRNQQARSSVPSWQ